MPITIVDGPTIAAGQSLSDGVDLSAGRIVRITTPADWSPANMTFKVSSDGTFFNDLYDSSGREVVIPCGPARGIVIDHPAFVESVAHLQIRSGSSAHPVAQAEDRVFAVAIETA